MTGQARDGEAAAPAWASLVARALAHLRDHSPADIGGARHPVTINFHPDAAAEDETVIGLLAADGIYRSQFETGTSGGGLSAFRGGERWDWESRTFGSAYDDAPPPARPKYGALNHRLDPVGGSRRFGSCHLRLAPHVRPRTSFCYPDSHMGPCDVALDGAGRLIALAEANRLGLDPLLDNYIEAHVHGLLRVAEDVDAVVVDPSYRSTEIARAADALGCRLEWHDGFRLRSDRLGACAAFRNAETAEALARIAEDGVVTPAVLGRACSRSLSRQVGKWAWHCLARFGHP